MEMVPHESLGSMNVLLGIGSAGAVVLGIAMVFFRGLSVKIRLLGAACFLAGLAILITVFMN